VETNANRACEAQSRLRFHAGPVGNDCPDSLDQLQLSGHEVGVDVCLDHPLDPQSTLGRLLEADTNVASRVDDDLPPCLLVAD
jgi:hypothetical protein